MQMLFNAMSENNCSENASRMQAMENSTKNASDMLEKLTLSYNRWALFLSFYTYLLCICQHWPASSSNPICMSAQHTDTSVAGCCCSPAAIQLAPQKWQHACRTRQAAITTELTEIISGAAALEG